jgi:hypothetical protein
VLPYRGVFGAPRPPALSGLALPPAPMPSRDGRRPLKSWRYIGVFGAELMLCLASIRIGPARQGFWAVWDRGRGRLYERTAMGRGAVRLEPGRARVIADRGVAVDLALEEGPGVETICPSGESYAWTRKQGGVHAQGSLVLDGVVRELDARAVIDDTAAYYQRHTAWRWCAGVGESVEGRALAWNLVEGVNDPPAGSERTAWVDHAPRELDPVRFASDLSAVGDLRFRAEATRESRQNLLILRSSYRQPFGTFSGSLAGDIELAHGYGVMEEHDVRW